MSSVKVINRAMNYDGSTVEIVEILHDRPIPGVGQRSYAVNHANGTIGVSSYADARRIVTGFGDVQVDAHDAYGSPVSAARAGFGLPDAALATVAEPHKEQTADAVSDHAPVTNE